MGSMGQAQVPSDALQQLKDMAGPGPARADSKLLREKYVQRGAASFVAQLRDTKDNSDMLVSLIFTKEMLLVAKKPRSPPCAVSALCSAAARCCSVCVWMSR
eukprot:3765264-Rhodomonas_salina.1